MTNLKDLNLNKYREWPDMLERIFEMKHNTMVWNWGAEGFISIIDTQGDLINCSAVHRHFQS